MPPVVGEDLMAAFIFASDYLKPSELLKRRAEYIRVELRQRSRAPRGKAIARRIAMAMAPLRASHRNAGS